MMLQNSDYLCLVYSYTAIACQKISLATIPALYLVAYYANIIETSLISDNQICAGFEYLIYCMAQIFDGGKF